MPAATIGEDDLPVLRSTILRLLSQSPTQPLPAISDAGWQALTRIAALHRLQPLLHHYHGQNTAVPEGVRAGWHDAFRAAALTALNTTGELAHTVRLLESAGLAPLALKGAWLAWHAYPHPALRPMRDIDLLLSAETVVPAFELLRAHGYAFDGPDQLATEEVIRFDKHMPPLVSPRGVLVELHQRLWEIDGRMDHASPAADLAAIRARAVRIGGIAYLAPQDTLVHLIIHAVYDHRLDCGPLVLSDIAALLAHSPTDWDAFWAEAHRGGWERGAWLVLALVRAHAPGAGVTLPADLAPPPAGFEQLAADLLLQELGTRQSAGVAATFNAAGPAAFLRRIFARRKRTDTHTAIRDLSAEGGFAAWAGSRLRRPARDLLRSTVRDQARDLARLSRWLDT